MSLPELESLTDEQLSAEVHEKVMGKNPFTWRVRGLVPVPPYATDLNICRLAEEKVCAEDSTRYIYQSRLRAVLDPKISSLLFIRSAFILATARERCIAMLLAVGA